MTNDNYKLVSGEWFSFYVFGQCVAITQDIIETYSNINIEVLKKRDLTIENAIEDYYSNFSKGTGLAEIFLSETFNHQLFLEVYFYVFTWADILQKNGSNSEMWPNIFLEAKEKFYGLLIAYLDLNTQRIQDIDRDFNIRHQQYSFKPTGNSFSLIQYIKPLIKGDSLIFSIAAYTYSITALGITLKNILLNKHIDESTYKINCPHCATELLGEINTPPFSITCEKCNRSFILDKVNLTLNNS